MKRLAVFILFFIFTISTFSADDGIDIFLPHQVALDLCSYPSVREGVIDLLYLYLDELWHRGEYSKIFPVLKLITTISPKDVEAWTIGGWFLINGIAPKLSTKEKDRIVSYAIEFMEEGIKANPEDERLYMELAMYYYTMKDYNKVLHYIENVEPSYPSYHFFHLKAHTYQKTGKIKEAIEVWERVKKDFPYMADVAERFIMELKDAAGENH
ncbi:MAG: hypothetical protein NC905_01770 [Candidatus Omnitrophica bacterium]|nr:hypothetical protein [Candidatus Omnitrophota bacterium]